MEGIIVMSIRELKRLKVIEQTIEKGLKIKKAAELLGLCVRQIKRLKKKVKEEGAPGVIHGLRGLASNHRHEESFKQRVLKIYREKYEGFGPTLAAEKLLEREKLRINRETLRQWMLEKGLWQKKRRGNPHRQWRERKGCFGEMVQVDGSHHDWLEGRGPKLVLMGYIDDATSRVYGQFYDYEGTLPALDSFYRYAKRYGLPQSVYMDRHSTYQGWERLTISDELAGRTRTQSQFGRAMEELGVEMIAAQSPEAKGRVERLFGTLQDRLVKEMRLAKVSNQAEANRFLEHYLIQHNRQFSKTAREEHNLHRPPPRNLVQILSIRTEHVMRNDNTIRHENRFYQILDTWSSGRPKQVRVEYRLDGKFYITHEGRALKFRQIAEAPKAIVPKKRLVGVKKPLVPPMSHPYKQKSYEHYLKLKQQKRTFLNCTKGDISILR